MKSSSKATQFVQNKGAKSNPMTGGRYPTGGSHQPPVAEGKTVGVNVRGTHVAAEEHLGVTRPHPAHRGSHDHLTREHGGE